MECIKMEYLTAKKVNDAIRGIKKAGKNFNEKTQIVAVSTLYHASEHGDHTLATKLVLAMPKSARQQSLIVWFESFSPLRFNTKKQAFTKSKKGGDFLVVEASEINWFEFTKEIKPKAFDCDKVFTAVVKAFNKAKDEDREIKGDIQKFLEIAGVVDNAYNTNGEGQVNLPGLNI